MLHCTAVFSHGILLKRDWQDANYHAGKPTKTLASANAFSPSPALPPLAEHFWSLWFLLLWQVLAVYTELRAWVPSQISQVLLRFSYFVTPSSAFFVPMCNRVMVVSSRHVVLVPSLWALRTVLHTVLSFSHSPCFFCVPRMCQTFFPMQEHLSIDGTENCALAMVSCIFLLVSLGNCTWSYDRSLVGARSSMRNTKAVACSLRHIACDTICIMWQWLKAEPTGMRCSYQS